MYSLYNLLKLERRLMHS